LINNCIETVILSIEDNLFHQKRENYEKLNQKIHFQFRSKLNHWKRVTGVGRWIYSTYELVKAQFRRNLIWLSAEKSIDVVNEYWESLLLMWITFDVMIIERFDDVTFTIIVLTVSS
jgi:hypothetical protein